ncbi:MAG: hypothetical protein HY347_11935 [candidate division NC10 bacterium]|nr:hypothetical protein [candidate division NC10 bacterium]
MAPRRILAGFLIGLFLASWVAPRFGAVEHDHQGGEHPHLHLRLSLLKGSTSHPHVHRSLHFHLLSGPVHGLFLASDLEPPLTHWHQFDDSIPTLAFSLDPAFHTLALAFLKSLPLISKQHPTVITRHSRAPPLPRAIS